MRFERADPSIRREPLGRGIGRILVTKLPGLRSRGKLVIGAQVVPCALGRTGITHAKREGDGGTPAGTFGIVCGWHRADRLPLVRTPLPMRQIGHDDGWCDDSADARYNRAVRLPTRASHERLWRDDGLYDFVLVLDYNLRHPARGRGSAIFFHVANPAWKPTAGCVAIRRGDLRRLLPRLTNRTRMTII